MKTEYEYEINMSNWIPCLPFRSNGIYLLLECSWSIEDVSFDYAGTHFTQAAGLALITITIPYLTKSQLQKLAVLNMANQFYSPKKKRNYTQKSHQTV